MKNFPIIDKETGREYWISRSVCVVAIVYSYSKDRQLYILANKRGKGTPDPEFVGTWCLPCGYLDFYETCQEAASREVFEETGLYLEPDVFTLIGIIDDPKKDKRQNVSFRFKAFAPDYIEDYYLTTEHSEANEVDSVKWIKFTEINNYQWAFNHDKIIKESLCQNLTEDL